MLYEASILFSTMEILPPKTVCTETYIVIDAFDTEEEAKNLYSYLSTRFVRFLVSQLVTTQHISKASFAFVPVQDLSETWTDEKLAEKYGLTSEERGLIDGSIRTMSSESFGGDSVLCVEDDGILRYFGPCGNELDVNTVGSWWIPFIGKESAVRVCKEAIKAGVVAACAHDDQESGFIYLYVDGTSDDDQRTLLAWLCDNDLLPREPDGSYTDIIYAYDVRSADNLTPDAKLSDYFQD